MCLSTFMTFAAAIQASKKVPLRCGQAFLCGNCMHSHCFCSLLKMNMHALLKAEELAKDETYLRKKSSEDSFKKTMLCETCSKNFQVEE